MNQAIVRAIVLGIGIVTAIFISVLLAESNVLMLLLVAIVAAGLFFTTIFWRWAFITAWCFVFLSLSWYPMGVHFGWEELAYLFPLLLAASTSWRQHNPQEPLPGGADSARKQLILATFIWAAYVGCLFAWRLLEIRAFGEPGLKNVAKSYAAIIIPAILTCYFATRSQFVLLPRRPERFFCLLAAGGILLGVALRLYQNNFANFEYDNLTGGFIAGPFILQYVNIVENIYSLRIICPIAVMLGALILTRPTGNRSLGVFLPAACVLLGFGGALVSGGRATIVICGLILAFILVMRRRWLILAMAAVAAIGGVLVLNLFARQIEDTTGNQITRSVSWLIFSERTKASGDIASSTRWRQMTLERALDDWTASIRNFTVGRGYQGFSESDYLDVSRMEFYEAIELSVRRGATHSLLSDSLLLTGLFGFCLYYVTILLGIRFGWRCAHEPTFSTCTQELAWILILNLGLRLTVGTVSGGLNGMTLDFLLVATIIAMARRDAVSDPATQLSDASETEESTYANQSG